MRKAILVFCGVLLLCVSARAQYRASIEGTVTDSQGAAVTRANVTVINADTGVSKTTVSSAEGFYRVDGLPPGNYTLRIVAPSFELSETTGVVVLAEQVRGVNAVLQVGKVTQTVVINAATAPALQTEDANISGTITTQQIENLPAFGRDPFELLRLAPGVFGDDARQSNGNTQNLPLQPGRAGPTAQSSRLKIRCRFLRTASG